MESPGQLHLSGSDGSQASLARCLDGLVELGADGVDVPLIPIDELLDRLGVALACVRLGQLHLRALQVGPERVDVVQPCGGTHCLGIRLDELKRVGVGIELFHQPEHGRDLSVMLDSTTNLGERLSDELVDVVARADRHLELVRSLTRELMDDDAQHEADSEQDARREELNVVRDDVHSLAF